MHIEDFYDQDERRRESEELELGNDWHDASGHRFEFNYVVDTGEAYLMSAPDTELIVADPFGDVAVGSEPVEALTVDVLATVPTADDLHRLLMGWEDAMTRPASGEWLRARLADVGTA